MNSNIFETKRLILRKFQTNDMESLYKILKDEEVNIFLPWFPAQSITDAQEFYESRIQANQYYFAICLKDNVPIGYINVEDNDSYDLGYGLLKEFWHKGIMTEASNLLIEQLGKTGIPYITATHDRNNLRSGGVMRQIGMKYCYSYEEQWQPKDFLVTFRMYQLNLDGSKDRVYKKYWNNSQRHFIEADL